MKHYFLLFVVCFLAVSLSGCGPKRPPTAKVSGTVLYKGQPLKQGTIIFEVSGNRPATGKIVDGKIVDVTTFEPNDGVSIGEAKIAINSKEEVEEAIPDATDPSAQSVSRANYMGVGGKPLIPPHYGNPTSSKLTATIESGKENIVNLELK